jgi:hypothetical protein
LVLPRFNWGEVGIEPGLGVLVRVAGARHRFIVRNRFAQLSQRTRSALFRCFSEGNIFGFPWLLYTELSSVASSFLAQGTVSPEGGFRVGPMGNTQSKVIDHPVRWNGRGKK